MGNQSFGLFLTALQSIKDRFCFTFPVGSGPRIIYMHNMNVSMY